MSLKEYKAKRNFKNTPEPKGKEANSDGDHKFVIQKHDASHLHYDFRLEIGGALKSWAVPKGPSMDPSVKRLAMEVEDHPMEYGSFEGIIPEGNYGAGTVMLWDAGTYHAVDTEGREANEKVLAAMWQKGNIKFVLNGKKIKGSFALVRTKGGKGNQWLLIKHKDDFATDDDITAKDKSVVTSRSLEQIANQSGSGDSVWHSGAHNHNNNSTNDIDLSKTEKAELPHDIKPMLATLVGEAFNSADWIFEIKWDGYRAIAECNYNKINLYSRNNLSFNDTFSTISESLKTIGLNAVLDGEVVVLNNNGKSEFSLIQNYKRTGKGNIVYYVFDILYYNGHDLTGLPLLERKEILKKIIPENNPLIKFNGHIPEKGKKFFEQAKKLGIEGIIGKKANSVYRTGTRSKDWVKVKILKEQEAVIAGYTEPRGGRKNLGALVLGVYNEQGDLEYLGHTGGGFNEASLQETYGKLKTLQTKNSPFSEVPKTNMPVHWVKPILVCEVKFQEWTEDAHMRQPIFLGLREDKNAKEVKREIINNIAIEREGKNEKAKIEIREDSSKSETIQRVERRKKTRSRESVKKDKLPAVKKSGAYPKYTINKELLLPEGKEEFVTDLEGKMQKFTNLNKLYWPEEKISKRELLDYYDKIANYLLPYLKDRPESLRRTPNGIDKPSFFHKDMPDTAPSWIQTKKIFSESNNAEVNYLICNDKATLLYMANLGCIEINPWNSRLQSLEYPDYVVIDLDPQDVPFEQVIEVAQAVKEVLDRAGAIGYCKTSGSRGLHIYIPLGAKYNYDQAKEFAHLIAQFVHELTPAITSLERSPAKRKNKIYLDYLQNRKGQTLAAPYCLRPKPGATVSTPLLWEEVKNGLHPSQFTISAIFERLKKTGDVFAAVLGKGIDMEKTLQNLKQLQEK